jgi:hypothetical protein
MENLSVQATEGTADIPPKTAARSIVWMLAGMLLTLAITLVLPINPYYRFQQGDGTALFRVRWIYERIHFDPTPIDVALIGSSRMEANVRANEVGRLLTANIGHPVHVVNFGLFAEGRDLHWAIVSELLRNRSDVRLIVLSAVPEANLSHLGFRFVGDDMSIVTSPKIYNKYYVENALTIPYRHIAYFVQGLWPKAFGLSAAFDPAIYLSRSFDPTESFFTPAGVFIDRDHELDPGQVSAQRRAVGQPGRGGGITDRFLTLDQRFPVERSFLRRIADLAQRKHVEIAFLRVPVYCEAEQFVDPDFYRAIGPVFEATQLGCDAADYMDIAHLNRRGTAKLAPWLADRLAPLLLVDAERQ